MKWTGWLIENGVISREQLDDADNLSRLRSMSLPDALLSFGYAEPWAITQAFSAEHGYSPINFYQTDIPADTIRTIPAVLARVFAVCPVAVRDAVLWYATPFIGDKDHQTRLARVLNRDVRPMWAPGEWIGSAERIYYSVCHVTQSASAWWFERYGDDEWILATGNRYQAFVSELETQRRAALGGMCETLPLIATHQRPVSR